VAEVRALILLIEYFVYAHEPYFYTENEIMETYIEKVLTLAFNVHFCDDTFY
jgi:hypothetical protein